MILALVALITTGSNSFVFAEKGTKEPPEIRAESAILYCDNTGETVFAKDEKKRLSPYSITKLMTCLLAVQKLPLDKEVKVSADAASMGESSMYLKEGEKVTVEELLYGALLPSGNDAAYALAEAVSGDVKSFVKLMNKTASNIGCEDTHFTNPSGMYDKEHYTTASDFLEILRVTMDNETIRKISGTGKYKMRPTNKSDARTLESHMDLLDDKKSGVVAGKTGLWTIDDCSIAVAYEKKGLDLYAVILKDTLDTRKDDLAAMIAYAEENIEGLKVIGKGKEVGKARIRAGAQTRLPAYTGEVGYAYLPIEGSRDLIKTETVMRTDVKAPVRKGTEVGTYKIYAGDDVVNEVPLVIHKDVKKGWFPSYLGISNRATVIILCVLGVILIIFMIMALIGANARRRRRKARQERIRKLAMEEARKEEERRKRNWNF